MNRDLSHRINIYRGFLCQYVILSHIIPSIFPGILGTPGTLAVWCFFVISGYLNYISFENSSGVRAYYFKRLKRLFPLLAVSFSIISFSENSLYVNDIYTLFPAIIDVKNNMPLNGVLWTIIIELQLYILTPLFYRLFQGMCRRKNYLLILIFSTAIISLVASGASSMIIMGTVDLDDRMFLSAIPFYIFGFFLTRTNLVFTRNMLNLCVIIAALLFLSVVADRNGLLSFLTLKWGWLFTLGKLIPLFLTSSIILYPIKKSYNPFVLTLLGKATYEIYLFHGLCAYLMARYFSEENTMNIMLFYWILPVIVGIFIFYCSIFLRKNSVQTYVYGGVK